MTQHVAANQAAAQSPTAGRGAPAAGPDASDDVATLRAQIEALQLRLASAPAGGGQQGGGGAAAATAQSTTPARSQGGGQPTPDPPTQPRRRGGRRRSLSEDGGDDDDDDGGGGGGGGGGGYPGDGGGWGGYDDEQDDGHADLGRGSIVSATAGHPLPLPHDQGRGIYARNALLWHRTNHYAPADAGDTASGAIYSRLERLRVTDLGSEWHASRELQRELSTAIPALSYLGDCIDYVEEALAELAEHGPALSRSAVAERLAPLSVQLTSIYSHINERIDELDELSQGAGGNGSAMRRAPYDALYGNTRRTARSAFGALVHDGFTTRRHSRAIGHAAGQSISAIAGGRPPSTSLRTQRRAAAAALSGSFSGGGGTQQQQRTQQRGGGGGGGGGGGPYRVAGRFSRFARPP